MNKINILLTNDDGYESSGLLALKDTLKDIANILIVAPASEKSACGHGLTLTRPLRFIRLDDDFYKLEDGTPSDCVYLALNAMYKESKLPDMVISGINLGSNMGEDTTYSGTVAAAMEGAIHGISSIAISQVMKDKNLSSDFDFGLAKQCIYDIVENSIKKGFPFKDRKLLNINIPQSKQSKGYKITQLGYRLYGNDAHIHRNPRGQEYHWLGLHPLRWEERAMPKDLESDFKAIKDGYISLTPLHVDLTSYEDIKTLNTWLGK